MKVEGNTLDSAWWALRIGLGVGPFLAGLDKFFNLLADWGMYLSPTVAGLLPMSPTAFMHVVGVIEMIVGLAILTRWTRTGAYVASAWLVAIALQLVTTGMFLDLAVRDVEIAIGAYTLARLTEWRQARVRNRIEETLQGGSSMTGGRWKHAMLALVALSWITVPAFAAETWKGVALVDTQCATRVKDNPDGHTTKCALQCGKNGYGVFAADGTYLKLDEAGNKLADAALKTTKKSDHIRATVTGVRQ